MMLTVYWSVLVKGGLSVKSEAVCWQVGLSSYPYVWLQALHSE